MFLGSLCSWGSRTHSVPKLPWGVVPTLPLPWGDLRSGCPPGPPASLPCGPAPLGSP